MMTPLLLLACTGNVVSPGQPTDSDDSASGPVLGEEIYDISRVLEVEIELDPQDWAEIREQKRNIYGWLASDACMQEPIESPYTWVSGTVTIDGETLENVAVRKKGLLGSVTPDRPSLKLRFDKYDEDQLFHGLTRLTFNNGRQDNSRIKTCMGYAIYEDLGIAASRCSFAHVTVNGEELGVYSNVEPVKREMLARVYEGDGTGDLYEGTLSDFREGWTGTFQDKEDSGDMAEIEAITDILGDPPDDLLGALDQHMDVEQFIAAWSADALIGHWDSYPANTNNFYVYVHPDGRLRFIPWGIDAILTGEYPFGWGQPSAVVARAALPQALYEDPEGRRLYWEQMERHLERWDGEELADRVEDHKALVKSYLWDGLDRTSFRTEVGYVEDFVLGREDVVLGEIAADPDLDLTDRAWPCLGEVGRFELAFETSWGSYGRLDTFSTGEGSMSLVYGGEEIPLEFMSAVFGEYAEGEAIGFVMGRTEAGGHLAWYGLAKTEVFTTAGEHQADWDEISAYILSDEDGDLQDWQTVAYIGGSFRLDQATDEIGEAMSGSADMVVYGASEGP